MLVSSAKKGIAVALGAAIALAPVAMTGNGQGAAVDVKRAEAALQAAAAANSLEGATVTVADRVYTGKPVKPIPRVMLGGKMLVPDRDYTTAYKNNVKPGSATVTVSGCGAYSGSKTVSFKIVEREDSASTKKDISAASVSVANQTYTGSSLTPVPKVTFAGNQLTAGRDYTVSYANNTNPGTATVTVKGTGDYKGSKSGQFKISKAQISKASISSVSAKYTTGLKAVKPAPKVTFGGKKLKKGTDYTLSYSNNVKPGTATVTVSGKGKFTGSKAVKFKLVNMGDDLAMNACRLAYSRTTKCYTKGGWQGGDIAGTSAYRKAYEKYVNQWNPRDCGRGAATIIRDAGYDPSWPKTRPGYESINFKTGKIVSGKLKRWSVVGARKNTGGKNWFDASSQRAWFKQIGIKPGDVCVWASSDNSSGHVFVYVGNKIANEAYGKYLKGHGTLGGDVGAPVDNACFVSAHLTNTSAPCIETANAAGGYNCPKGTYFMVLRCVNPACK